jgi:hypothetical protein
MATPNTQIRVATLGMGKIQLDGKRYQVQVQFVEIRVQSQRKRQEKKPSLGEGLLKLEAKDRAASRSMCARKGIP